MRSDRQCRYADFTVCRGCTDRASAQANGVLLFGPLLHHPLGLRSAHRIPHYPRHYKEEERRKRLRWQNQRKRMPMKTRTLSMLAVALAWALAATDHGLAGNGAASPASPPGETADIRPAPKPPPGRPQDFFPLATGTTWRYEITIGPAEPLDYYESEWPWGKGRRLTCTRRLPVRDFKEAQAKDHFLELRLKGEADQPVSMFPNGYEIEVVQDDLTLFQPARALYFATRVEGGFEAAIVATYPAEDDSMSRGPWGSWGNANAPDGHGFRLSFFGQKPGTEIAFGKNPHDHLLFVGVVENHAEIKGSPGPLLHFRRRVDPSEREDDHEPSYLDKGWTADLYYGRGLGLVRLEQRVEGVRSMVWTLKGNTTTTELKAANQGVARTAGTRL
jgi:hypothetical protein